MCPVTLYANGPVITTPGQLNEQQPDTVVANADGSVYRASNGSPGLWIDLQDSYCRFNARQLLAEGPVTVVWTPCAVVNPDPPSGVR